ncbi:hypothetical protein N0V84_002591 [Fusarium piperis]|uniref:Uncharacterized protein n=1 Tax=Fusarium piperis TaxID=1435070 RepID=A0A9W8WJ27_9HYPO|nr:hypothetical protein N0V84_002591 [Fusarium piperis]
MLSLPSPVSRGALEGIYTWCQKCGAGCTIPDGERFRDLLGERSIYCTNKCWWQHGQERCFTHYGGFANPIICEPPLDPDTILPMVPQLPIPSSQIPVLSSQALIPTPRYKNLRRPNPKDILWPAPEMPKGASGYGHPNIGWLHYMPDAELYGYLIDSFRLRMQDIKGRPITRLDIFYREWRTDMAGFKHYLDLAERTPGLLPIEWKSKRAACESLCRLKPYYDLSNLDTLDKQSIMKHYDGKRGCLLKLRELAQAVFGYSPGNCNLNKL